MKLKLVAETDDGCVRTFEVLMRQNFVTRPYIQELVI